MASSSSSDDKFWAAFGFLVVWAVSYWCISWAFTQGYKMAGYKEAEELRVAVARQETIARGADVVLNSSPPVTDSTKLLRQFHETSAKAAQDKETAERKLAKLAQLEELPESWRDLQRVVSVGLFPLAGAVFAAWAWADERKRKAAQQAHQERMAAKFVATRSPGLSP